MAPIQKGLRMYGTLIGSHPLKWALLWFVICAAILIGGWTTRADKPVMNPKPLAEAWGMKGSDTMKNTEIYNKYHGTSSTTKLTNDWQTKTSTTMFVAKKTKEHNDIDKMDDIATKDAFLEMKELTQKWSTLSTEVDGHTYTTHDLCSRGILPDVPLPANLQALPQMKGVNFLPPTPCSVQSPLHCFEDAITIAHPDYQKLDALKKADGKAMIGDIFPGGYLSYTLGGKPKLKDSTDDQVKAALSQQYVKDKPDGQSRGCIAEREVVFYFADIWGGKIKWSGGKDSKMTKLGAMRNLIYLDGIARVAYRLSLTHAKTTKGNLENIKKAQKQLSHKWAQTVYDFNKQAKFVEVANVEDLDFYTLPEMEEELLDANMSYFVGGAGALLVFTIGILISFGYPQASRVVIGLQGLVLVIFSLGTALGLLFACDGHLNAASINAIPLLALGLGVDDMFILLRYFSELGQEFIQSNDPKTIVGEVMARAGPGVALTSICNILAFSCGSFLPIIAMAEFCLAGAFVALFNFIVMVNIFLPLLVQEVYRAQANRPELCCLTFFCHRSAIAKASAAGPEDSSEGRSFVKATCSQEYKSSFAMKVKLFLKDKYAPCLGNPIVCIILTVLALAKFAVCIYFIQESKLGWGPGDLIPEESLNKKGMDWLFTRFSLFDASFCIHNIDVAENQKGILQLFNQITSQPWTKYGMPNPAPNWITMVYTVVTGGVTADVTASVTKKFAAKMLPTNNTAFKATVNSEVVKYMKKSYGLDQSWTHPVLAPLGTFTTDSVNFNNIVNSFRSPPTNPADIYKPANAGAVYMDAAQASQFYYSNYACPAGHAACDPTKGYMKPYFSKFPFINMNMDEEGIYIEAIKDMKKTIKDSPYKDSTFVQSGILTFWEVFEELRGQTNILIAIDAVIIFFITLLMFGLDVVTALITCLSCSMIVLEIYGIAASIMKFNIFIAALCLMGMGLSVEFTVHLAASFSLGEGTAVERLGHSMMTTFPALMEGSLSTFLGILPLAFHPIAFIVKYIFGIIALTVAVGLVNGLVFMPAMLLLLSKVLWFLPCSKGNKAKEEATTADPPKEEAKVEQPADPEKPAEGSAAEENI